MAEPRSSRKRTKTSRFEFEFLDNEEQLMIQQALKISRKDVKRVEVDLPESLTFYPTSEEFVDPLAYINKIRPEAQLYGVVKIVPPPDWNHELALSFDNPKRFPTKLQSIHTLMQGQGFDDGKSYNIAEYRDMANRFAENWKNNYHSGREPSTDLLCKDYWDIVETGSRSVTVEYGNDVDSSSYGSGFPSLKSSGIKQETADKYSRWNINNLPIDSSSLLRFLKVPINGITVPWVYIGMLFASFCWHYEDNNLYSINFSHYGAVKQWYGVPGSQADAFEKVSKDYLLGLFRESPDILHHMTTQIPPSLLASNGIKVYKMAQEAGTIIITFPKSFHCGFSCGFNVGEAVNFATFDWLPFGGIAEQRYRTFGREPVFSHHRLLFTLLRNKDQFQQKEIQELYKQIIRVLEDEIKNREHIISQGVRDLSKSVVLPENDFTCITQKTIDYDDMRSCALCKQVCVFTAVGCECDKVKVTCPAHHHLLCRCPREKKFMLAWAKTSALTALKSDLVGRLQ